jgi:hypothetical protein
MLQPVFSHEKLVIDAALDLYQGSDVYSAACIVDALDRILDQSLEDQKKIDDYNPVIKSLDSSKPVPQCFHCKSYSYISHSQCGACKHKFCLKHAAVHFVISTDATKTDLSSSMSEWLM